MRRAALKTLLFVAMLAAFAADFTVGCSQGYVYGPVQQKVPPHEDAYIINVGGETYDVPMSFYYQVQVGDVVKFDGREWTVVKRGPTTFGSPTPSPSPSPSPSSSPSP